MGEMIALTGISRNTLKDHFRSLLKNNHLKLRKKGRGSWYELPWPERCLTYDCWSIRCQVTWSASDLISYLVILNYNHDNAARIVIPQRFAIANPRFKAYSPSLKLFDKNIVFGGLKSTEVSPHSTKRTYDSTSVEWVTSSFWKVPQWKTNTTSVTNQSNSRCVELSFSWESALYSINIKTGLWNWFHSWHGFMSVI